MFYCFGCQAKGDVITFVREIEHVDFVEAVEKLAARAGIELHYDDNGGGQERKRKQLAMDALGTAGEWYHERLLTAPDAAAARGYLRQRGFDGDTVREFKLGWAPDDWDSLAKSLKLPANVLIDAGLAFRNKRDRMQDSFRGRIMFPIFDAAGKPVAFGGRVIDSQSQPKYKNSAETVVYSKRRTLFGLNWAKTDVVAKGEVIVCEGYTDVIGLFRSGVPRAVATCGTALAEDHVRLLKNFARRIVLAYDADSAGQSAADKFYEWEKKYDLDIAVATLPRGEDPASLAQRDPAGLQQAIETAKPYLAFRIDRVVSAGDLRTPEGRARTAEAAMTVVREHPSPLVRDQYLVQVADRCRIDIEQLRRLIGRSRAPIQTQRSRPARELRGPETEALRIAVHRPELLLELIPDVAGAAELFDDDLHASAYRALVSADTLRGAIDAAEPEAAALLQKVAVEEPPNEDSDAFVRLVEQAGRRALQRLDADMRAAQEPPEATMRAVAWLRTEMESLRETSSAPEAVKRLVPWLITATEEQ